MGLLGILLGRMLAVSIWNRRHRPGANVSAETLDLGSAP